jgi:hypothetical protein
MKTLAQTLLGVSNLLNRISESSCLGVRRLKPGASGLRQHHQGFNGNIQSISDPPNDGEGRFSSTVLNQAHKRDTYARRFGESAKF